MRERERERERVRKKKRDAGFILLMASNLPDASPMLDKLSSRTDHGKKITHKRHPKKDSEYFVSKSVIQFKLHREKVAMEAAKIVNQNCER